MNNPLEQSPKISIQMVVVARQKNWSTNLTKTKDFYLYCVFTILEFWVTTAPLILAPVESLGALWATSPIPLPFLVKPVTLVWL